MIADGPLSPPLYFRGFVFALHLEGKMMPINAHIVVQFSLLERLKAAFWKLQLRLICGFMA